MLSLDARFPSWRSIETFGPPGAGKTYLCRIVTADHPEFFTTAEDPRGAAFSYPRTEIFSSVGFVVPPGLLAPYLKVRRNRLIQAHWRTLNANCPDFCRAVEAVASLPILTEDMRSHVLKKIQLTCFQLGRAAAEGAHLIVDEGTLRKLMTVLQRAILVGKERDYSGEISAVLGTYPWQRFALMVTAAPSTCLTRQVARGSVVASTLLPQQSYHHAAEELLLLCESLGWKCATIDNNTQPGDATASVSQ